MRSVLQECVHQTHQSGRYVGTGCDRDAQFGVFGVFPLALLQSIEDTSEAMINAEHAVRLAPWHGFSVGVLAGLLSLAGETERADKLIETLSADTAARLSAAMIFLPRAERTR